MAKRKYKFSDGRSGAAINVKVIPHAAKDEISGVHADGVLKIRVTASPVDSAANDQVIQLLAEALGIASDKVEVVAGHSGTHKLVSIEGVQPIDLDQKLGLKVGSA